MVMPSTSNQPSVNTELNAPATGTTSVNGLVTPPESVGSASPVYPGTSVLEPDAKASSRAWVLKLLLFALALAVAWVITFMVVPASWAGEPLPGSASDLSIQSIDDAQATIYLIKVPPSHRYEIIPVVSRYLEPLPDLVNKVRPVAVAGINAGFFDPNNRQTTSYVIAQEQILETPISNRNFVENPELFEYMPQMLNRSEFRMLSCKGGEIIYDIAKHRDEPPHKCKVIHSIQAGPNLFEPNGAQLEAFVAFKNGQTVRDPIGVNRPNARSAIGIDTHGNVLLVMASQKKSADDPTDEAKTVAASGLTLDQLANTMKKLGAIKALALDGGSSSSMWFDGETYTGKFSKNQPLLRPIKSAFVVIRKDMSNALSR